MVLWDVERLIYGTGQLHGAASLRIHLSPDYVTVNVMAFPFVGEGVTAVAARDAVVHLKV